MAYPTWNYQKSVWINTTETGAHITNNVDNFPLLITLTNTFFDFSEAKDDGSDIRFSQGSSELSYEIEVWDKTNSLAKIWVLIPTVQGNNNSQFINIHWGNASATSESDGTKVFKSVNNTLACWHLNNSLEDATGNSGTATDNGTIDNDGMIGRGRKSENNSNTIYSQVPNLPTGNQERTLSFWFYPKEYASEKINAVCGYPYNSQGSGTNGAWFQVCYSDYGDKKWGIHLFADRYFANTVCEPNNWYHVTATYNGTTIKIFVNGEEDMSVDYSLVTQVNASGLNFNVFGVLNPGTSDIRVGVLDEVRIQNSAMSDDWIKLSYETQRDDADFLGFEKSYDEWLYSTEIELDTTSDGANVSEDLTSFPMLLRLNQENFDFSQSKIDGSDIRFSTIDSSPLYYEIERWDNTNKRAEIWILLNNVLGDTPEQLIKMYWGNSKASSASNPGFVFNKDNGFQGVWHFKESDDTVLDSTSNSYNGTNLGSSIVDEGYVGPSREFIRVDEFNGDKVTVAGNSTNLRISSDMTLSAWVKFNTINDFMGIISKTATNYRLTFDDIEKVRVDIGGRKYVANAQGVFQTGTWYYLGYSYDKSESTLKLFLDGAQLGDTLTVTASPNATNAQLQIGADSNDDYLDGEIDEPRIENVSRTNGWIKLCFENQKTNQTFYKIKVPEPVVVDQVMNPFF